MSHAREAKQLCRKLVNLFSMMSQITPQGGHPPQQDLFDLITQLAHYLKILIRIALTGAIKLERDYSNPTAMTNTLARLNLLAQDGGDPTVHKRGMQTDRQFVPKPFQTGDGQHATSDEEQVRRAIGELTRAPVGYIPSTENIAYGYRSLAVSNRKGFVS